MSPSTSTVPSTPVPTFESLGVRPLINCWGTYTIISGSRMVPQAAKAMYEATNHYVHMEELMDRVGARLAELTGAEWGLITCGCAAAINQITAACIAGADPEKMARLPDSSGMKNEVISQKAHRNGYDRGIQLAGGSVIEVVTEADLRSTISERTAMITITGDSEAASTIPIAKMIEIGRQHGIPCFVDAAAQRLSVPNRYLEMGANAVAYSGGKCLRGPQASGLLLGDKALLQAAYLNGAPHHGEARPMKAGKEEIMALLAAVEAFINGRDHEAEWRMWESYLDIIRRQVEDIPGVRTEIKLPGIANVAPILAILWEEGRGLPDPQTAYAELLNGEPRIVVHRYENGIGIMPYMMEDGDAEVVAPCIRSLLLGAEAFADAADEVAPPDFDLAGAWKIHTQYLLGESDHAMTLEQQGNTLTGTYRSQFEWSPIRGTICGDRVVLRTRLGYQSIRDAYDFEGTVSEGGMTGTLCFGGRWQADWTAQRHG